MRLNNTHFDVNGPIRTVTRGSKTSIKTDIQAVIQDMWDSSRVVPIQMLISSKFCRLLGTDTLKHPVTGNTLHIGEYVHLDSDIGIFIGNFMPEKHTRYDTEYRERISNLHVVVDASYSAKYKGPQYNIDLEATNYMWNGHIYTFGYDVYFKTNLPISILFKK